MRGVKGSTECGTVGGYKLGCRCDACRAATARYYRELRALHRRRGRIPAHVKHGEQHCYLYYGCRCLACRVAAAKNRKRFARNPKKAVRRGED